MGFADRYDLSNRIQMSDAGMEVRSIRNEVGTEAKLEVGSKTKDIWRSPLDDMPTPEKQSREKTGDQMRLENLIKPYTAIRLQRNPRTTTTGEFWSR